MLPGPGAKPGDEGKTGAMVPKQINKEEYAKKLGVNIQAEEQLFNLISQVFDFPLPEPWTEKVDRKSRIFYWNPKSRTSSWTHPLDTAFKLLVDTYRRAYQNGDWERVVQEEIERLRRACEEELKKWREVQGENNKVYYYHVEGRETRWDNPRDELTSQMSRRTEILMLLMQFDVKKSVKFSEEEKENQALESPSAPVVAQRLKLTESAEHLQQDNVVRGRDRPLEEILSELEPAVRQEITRSMSNTFPGSPLAQSLQRSLSPQPGSPQRTILPVDMSSVTEALDASQEFGTAEDDPTHVRNWMLPKEYSYHLGLRMDNPVDADIYRVLGSILYTPLPVPWRADLTDTRGGVVFYHPGRKFSCWTHPLEPFFRDIVQFLRVQAKAGACPFAEALADEVFRQTSPHMLRKLFGIWVGPAADNTYELRVGPDETSQDTAIPLGSKRSDDPRIEVASNISLRLRALRSMWEGAGLSEIFPFANQNIQQLTGQLAESVVVLPQDDVFDGKVPAFEPNIHFGKAEQPDEDTSPTEASVQPVVHGMLNLAYGKILCSFAQQQEDEVALAEETAQNLKNQLEAATNNQQQVVEQEPEISDAQPSSPAKGEEKASPEKEYSDDEDEFEDEFDEDDSSEASESHEYQEITMSREGSASGEVEEQEADEKEAEEKEDEEKEDDEDVGSPAEASGDLLGKEKSPKNEDCIEVDLRTPECELPMTQAALAIEIPPLSLPTPQKARHTVSKMQQQLTWRDASDLSELVVKPWLNDLVWTLCKKVIAMAARPGSSSSNASPDALACFAAVCGQGDSILDNFTVVPEFSSPPPGSPLGTAPGKSRLDGLSEEVEHFPMGDDLSFFQTNQSQMSEAPSSKTLSTTSRSGLQKPWTPDFDGGSTRPDTAMTAMSEAHQNELSALVRDLESSASLYDNIIGPPPKIKEAGQPVTRPMPPQHDWTLERPHCKIDYGSLDMDGLFDCAMPLVGRICPYQTPVPGSDAEDLPPPAPQYLVDIYQNLTPSLVVKTVARPQSAGVSGAADRLASHDVDCLLMRGPGEQAIDFQEHESHNSAILATLSLRKFLQRRCGTLEAAFEELDKNKSGMITRQQWAEGLAEMKYNSAIDVQDVFNILDLRKHNVLVISDVLGPERSDGSGVTRNLPPRSLEQQASAQLLTEALEEEMHKTMLSALSDLAAQGLRDAMEPPPDVPDLEFLANYEKEKENLRSATERARKEPEDVGDVSDPEKSDVESVDELRRRSGHSHEMKKSHSLKKRKSKALKGAAHFMKRKSKVSVKEWGCPDCNDRMDWSNYAGFSYADGWSCNNIRQCGHSSSDCGPSRWFCKKCSNDFCTECADKLIKANPSLDHSRGSAVADPIEVEEHQRRKSHAHRKSHRQSKINPEDLLGERPKTPEDGAKSSIFLAAKSSAKFKKAKSEGHRKSRIDPEAAARVTEDRPNSRESGKFGKSESHRLKKQRKHPDDADEEQGDAHSHRPKKDHGDEEGAEEHGEHHHSHKKSESHRLKKQRKHPDDADEDHRSHKHAKGDDEGSHSRRNDADEGEYGKRHSRSKDRSEEEATGGGGGGDDGGDGDHSDTGERTSESRSHKDREHRRGSKDSENRSHQDREHHSHKDREDHKASPRSSPRPSPRHEKSHGHKHRHEDDTSARPKSGGKHGGDGESRLESHGHKERPDKSDHSKSRQDRPESGAESRPESRGHRERPDKSDHSKSRQDRPESGASKGSFQKVYSRPASGLSHSSWRTAGSAASSASKQSRDRPNSSTPTKGSKDGHPKQTKVPSNQLKVPSNQQKAVRDHSRDKPSKDQKKNDVRQQSASSTSAHGREKPDKDQKKDDVHPQSASGRRSRSHSGSSRERSPSYSGSSRSRSNSYSGSSSGSESTLGSYSDSSSGSYSSSSARGSPIKKKPGTQSKQGLNKVQAKREADKRKAGEEAQEFAYHQNQAAKMSYGKCTEVYRTYGHVFRLLREESHAVHKRGLPQPKKKQIGVKLPNAHSKSLPRLKPKPSGDCMDLGAPGSGQIQRDKAGWPTQGKDDKFSAPRSPPTATTMASAGSDYGLVSAPSTADAAQAAAWQRMSGFSLFGSETGNQQMRMSRSEGALVGDQNYVGGASYGTTRSSSPFLVDQSPKNRPSAEMHHGVTSGYKIHSAKWYDIQRTKQEAEDLDYF